MINKWLLLSTEERDLLENLALADNGMTLRWSDMLHRLIHVGLVSKVSRDADYTYRVAITAKGRALIPATPAPTDDLARLQAENARLREALAFYSDKDNYRKYYSHYDENDPLDTTSNVQDDAGETARKALEGGE